MTRTDRSVIAHLGRFDILATSHEVMWPDGTAVALHPVRENGIDSLYLRALLLPAGMRIVFDLRKICPPLTVDLQVAHERDRIGVVYYGLRHGLKTSAELLMRATERLEAFWTPEQEAMVAA